MQPSIVRAFYKLAVVFGLLATPFTPAAAMGFNASGTGPPERCAQYQVLSPMVFEGGKALSAQSAEYYFSVLMSEGASGGECGATVGSYTAKIKARWDGETKRAYETIVHQAPATGRVTEVVASCPENPWTASANPDCALVSITNDASRLMYEPAIVGPYPVSAYRIGYTGRQTIDKTVSWVGSADFILPPTTAPRVVAADDGLDIDGRFYKRNHDVQARVQPPSDGSPEWYARNLKSYDLQVQVKVIAKASGYLIPNEWISKSVVTSVPGDAPDFTLPYARLFDDPDANWAVESTGERGTLRPVRVRVRIHDNTVVRPWSSWRSFQVEVPLRVTKVPRGIDPKNLGGVSGASRPSP